MKEEEVIYLLSFDQIDELEERNEIDFEIGNVLQEQVLRYSVDYYMGIYGGDFEDEEDLSQIDEGDETNSEDEKKKKNKQSGGRKGSKEECTKQ